MDLFHLPFETLVYSQQQLAWKINFLLKAPFFPVRCHGNVDGGQKNMPRIVHVSLFYSPKATMVAGSVNLEVCFAHFRASPKTMFRRSIILNLETPTTS